MSAEDVAEVSEWMKGVLGKPIPEFPEGWKDGVGTCSLVLAAALGFVAEGETVDPRPAEELPDALVAPRTTADPTDAVGDVEAPEGAARPGFGIASPANAETAQ
jgi:hypothetical protein